MIKPIEPPHVDAADTKAQITQIKRYLQNLANDLNFVLSVLENRICDEDTGGRASE